MIINVLKVNDAKLLKEKMNSKTVCIVLYYSENCIYCKMMMPEWNKFESKYADNDKCIIVKVESQNLYLLDNKPDIMGYPSIFKYIKGNKTEYKGDRSCEDLEKFSNIKPKPLKKSKVKKTNSKVKKTNSKVNK